MLLRLYTSIAWPVLIWPLLTSVLEDRGAESDGHGRVDNGGSAGLSTS